MHCLILIIVIRSVLRWSIANTDESTDWGFPVGAFVQRYWSFSFSHCTALALRITNKNNWCRHWRTCWHCLLFHSPHAVGDRESRPNETIRMSSSARTQHGHGWLNNAIDLNSLIVTIFTDSSRIVTWPWHRESVAGYIDIFYPLPQSTFSLLCTVWELCAAMCWKAQKDNWNQAHRLGDTKKTDCQGISEFSRCYRTQM